MILAFKLQASGGKVRASAPEVGFDHEIRDLVGLDKKSRQIVAIGDTADDIKANAPEYWERNKGQIEFERPFDCAGHAKDGKFEPLLAARIVQYFSNKAFALVDRRGLGRMITSPWVDRVDYTLELDGFMQLSVKQRREFFKHLKKLLVAPKRISINGEVVWSK